MFAVQCVQSTEAAKEGALNSSQPGGAQKLHKGGDVPAVLERWTAIFQMDEGGEGHPKHK